MAILVYRRVIKPSNCTTSFFVTWKPFFLVWAVVGFAGFYLRCLGGEHGFCVPKVANACVQSKEIIMKDLLQGRDF